jgi:hypothetical protein
VEYILSTGHVQETLAGLDPVERDTRVTTLRASIDGQIAIDGQVIVTKDSGVLIASGS